MDERGEGVGIQIYHAHPLDYFVVYYFNDFSVLGKIVYFAFQKVHYVVCSLGFLGFDDCEVEEPVEEIQAAVIR